MSLEQLKRDFDRDGYVVVRGFLSREELEELRIRAEGCLGEARRSEEYPGVVKNLNRIDPWFEDQLQRGKQAELISALLEDDLEPASAGCFERIPGETSGIKPHIDASGHRRKGATVWIALDRADRENGCLFYVKGTHRQDLPSVVGLEGFSAESEEAVAVEVEPGDATIHNSRTVHWSEANRSQRPRQAITYFYWAASTAGGTDG
ncbi:MAG: phytanoyl-CoA dioxygenase family protein [Acidobacteria bacterium]|nr:phytanoyl-CoA dioxygenase family protein [Acidobacteriota bacterium]